MPAFIYQGIDPGGRRVRGRSEAATGAALQRALEDGGLVVLQVHPAGADSGGRWHPGRRRALLEVTRALAALLPTGMPLTRALTAATHVAPGPMAEVITAIRVRVERGAPLAEAIAERETWFPPLYVGMVRAGERGGDLAGAFRRLAEQLEREEALRARLVSASIYPVVLAVAGGAAVLVLLLFVIPRFVELLDGADVILPTSTRLLLSVSEGLRSGWPLLAGTAAAGVLLAGGLAASPSGRRALAQTALALPLLGRLRRQALGARFARILGTLLNGGAPLLRALDDTQESMADPLARDEGVRIRARVREGSALNAAMAVGGLYPPMLSQLVAVGEEAGQLPAFLLKGAEILEERTEREAQRLAALAEPAMIVLFGILVGFVAFSLLQAIYGVNAGAFR